MTENEKKSSLTLIKLLLVIIALAVCLQAYWTYIAYEEEIKNFHDSEYREKMRQEEKIKALEQKIQELQYQP